MTPLPNSALAEDKHSARSPISSRPVSRWSPPRHPTASPSQRIRTPSSATATCADPAHRCRRLWSPGPRRPSSARIRPAPQRGEGPPHGDNVRPGLTRMGLAAELSTSVSRWRRLRARILTFPQVYPPSHPGGWGPSEDDAEAWADFAKAWEAGDDEAVGRAWSQLSPRTRIWAGRAWSMAVLANSLALDPEEFEARMQEIFDASAEKWLAQLWAARAWSARDWSDDKWLGRAWSGRAWSDENWLGRAWSGRAWSDLDWAGACMVGPGMVRSGMEPAGLGRSGMVRSGMVRPRVVRSGVVRSGMVRSGMVRVHLGS